METTVQRWGNSLGVRIPKSFAEEAGFEAGSTVDMTLKSGGVVIRPARPRRYVLATLLKGISGRNLHQPVETGAPVGREVW